MSDNRQNPTRREDEAVISTDHAHAIERQLVRVEKSVDRIERQMDGIGQSLIMLARLEERHNSTREWLTAVAADVRRNSERLNAIEENMPGLKELRRWVLVGIGTGLTLMAGAAKVFFESLK